ncbi:acyl-CoA thioesterase [Leucobacter muris]|jgi:acyl-CoA hydrolase|uniref:Acyl-CoA thioesterase n=1 Tax=Leucobacter muris TaxID=1935379 RepID=A0ABX5QC45_9MICO|nr:hotdog domain-containing protein [Leucobacter muris]QAB16593.1 acyl-CoA thioesterase [Leucobacter muris]
MSEYRHVVRKWVKPEDLNQHGALFGGRLLQWVDEEAAIVAVAQLGTIDVVTRHMSAIDFSARADRGDLLELEYRVAAFGRTSITLSCRVENAVTGQQVLTLDRIVFVAVDAEGHAVAHGRTAATEGTERLRDPGAPARRGEHAAGAGESGDRAAPDA